MTSKISAKQNEIVAALRRVALKSGLGATNVRSVAKEAGISPASVLYYFDSMENLFDQAIAAVLNEYYQQRASLLVTIKDPRERILALINAGVPDEVSEDLRLVYGALSMLPQSARPLLALQSILEKQILLYFTTIEIGAGLGFFTPQPNSMAVARNIVAIEDSYDIYPLINMDVSRQELRDNLISYARLALGCDML